MSILKKNGHIFTETHVQEVSANGIKTSDGFQVDAQQIVIGTNAPIVDKVSKIYDKQVPYRTYVIGALIKKEQFQKHCIGIQAIAIQKVMLSRIIMFEFKN